jgi:hypothetical protein
MAVTPDQLADFHRPKAAAPPKPAASGSNGHGGHGNEHNNGHGGHGDGNGNGHGNGHTPPAESAAPSTDWSMSVRKNILVQTDGSQVELDDQRRPTGNQEEERVVLREPLRDQYKKFLNNYATKLARLNQRNEGLLQGTTHAHDRLLLQELVDSHGEVSEQKIEAFLSTPKNWEIATLALELHASRLMFSLGIAANFNVAGERTSYHHINQDTIYTGIDQSRISRFLTDRFGPVLNAPLRQGGRTEPLPNWAPHWANRRWVAGLGGITAGVAAALYTGDLQAAAAVIATGVGIAGINHLTRDGLTINLTRCAETFQSIASDPVEQRFMSEMTGIDLNRLQVVNNQIVAAPGQGDYIPSVNPDEILKQAIGMQYTRQEMLTTLGVRYEDLDEMQESFLTQGGHNPEQTGFVGHIEVRRYFDTVLGGQGPDIADNLRRWRQAQAHVITEKLQHEIEHRANHGAQQKLLTDLEDVLKDPEKLKQKEVAEHTAKKEALTRDKGNIASERKKIEQYQKSIATHRESIEKDRTKVDTDLKNALASVRQPAAGGAPGAPYPDVNSAIAALYKVLDSAGSEITINSRSIKSTKERYDAAEAEYMAPTPPQGPTESNSMFAQRQQRDDKRKLDKYERDKARINEDAQLITETINKLKASTNQTVTDSSLSSTNEQVIEATKSLDRLRNDFQTVIDIESALVGAGGSGVGLSEATLRTESIDRLMERINQANATNDTLGWPKEQNSTPERRAQLLRAKTEATARNILQSRNGRVVRGNYLYITQRWNITDHELNTMTREQIYQTIQSRRTTNPLSYGGLLLPTINAIETAREDSRDLLSARVDAMERLEEEFSVQAQLEENAAASVDTEQTERKFTLARDLLKNQGPLFDSSQDIANNPTRYFNRNPANAASENEFTQAERNYLIPPAPGTLGPGTSASVGYLNFMDKVFSYRKGDAATTEKNFNEVVKLLPPVELADILDDIIVSRSVVGPRPITDINTVLDNTEYLIQQGVVSFTEIQEVLERVVNTVARKVAVQRI